MPRVSEVLDAGDNPVLGKVFDAETEMYGQVLNTTRVMAHCPPVLAAAKALYASFARSAELPAALHALVHVRVATLNGCPF
jgi:alkylhydroperoxidase family enzyme